MDDFDFDWDMPGDLYDISSLGDIDWGSMLGDFGDTGFDDYLGIELPTFGNEDLAGALLGSESDVSFNKAGDMVFTNPDGTVVTYTADGMVRTEDPSGRNVFYHTTDGRDYTVDYSSLKPGDLVETYGRDTTGGPTRYSAYHTTDGKDYFVDYTDAFDPKALVETFSRDTGGTGPTRYTAYTGNGVVDYSDVYGPGGGRVTTTPGDGKTTTIYQDGGVKTVTNNTVTNTVRDIVKTFTNAVGGKDNAALLAALLGGIAAKQGGKGGGGGTGVGYQGGIPTYTATRGPARSPTEGGRRPGAAGIGSLTGGVKFTPTGGVMGNAGTDQQVLAGLTQEELERIRQATKVAAKGGLMSLASGGQARPARYLAGGTDGMADEIETDIDGKQPARLSHGEFVIPADVVSHLGNGNSDAGAKVLYDMMAKVRKARTGTPKQGKQINPNSFVPGKGR